MRKQLLFVISMIAFGLSIGLLAVIKMEQDYQLRGYTNPAEDQNLPFRIPRLGVNTELIQYSPNELQQHLSWMEEANITWVRQFIRWDEVEPEQGNYQWEQWDAIVAAVGEFPNLQLVAVLVNSPEWARLQSPNQSLTVTAPPAHVSDFANFARQFAERYADSIDVYQVWDEPNLDDAWGGLNPNPSEYVALLQSVYQAIHSHDETSIVISAALAPTIETSGQNISDIRYLQELYRLGAQPYMDAVAGKPYGFNTSSQHRTVDETVLNFSRLIALREVMVANGDGKKPLWASHWGWNALPDDWQGDASIWGQVTAEEQHQYTLEALTRAEHEWPWLGGMILHHWQPDVELDNPQWGFALINSDNQPTPLYNAITNRHQLNSAQDGLYHPLTTYAQYSGVWEFSPRGADIGWLDPSDSQLEFDFYGTDVALLLREGDYVAFLYPQIDGQPANATPHDTDGNAYIFLRSAVSSEDEKLVQPEIILEPVGQNLSLDNHTLQITADRGWNQWALAGFAISSGDLARPFQQRIVLLVTSTILSGFASLFYATKLNWQPITTPLKKFIAKFNPIQQLILSFIASIILMLGMLLTWGEHYPQLLHRSPVPLTIAMIALAVMWVTGSMLLTIIGGLLLFIVIFHRLEVGLILAIFWSPFFLFPVELNDFGFPIAGVITIISACAFVLQTTTHFAKQYRQKQISTVHLTRFDLLAVVIIFGNVFLWIFTAQLPDNSLEFLLIILELVLIWLIWRHINLNYFDIALFALLIIALLSIGWATYLPPAFDELRKLILEPLLFYGLFRQLALDKTLILNLVQSLILAGLAVSVIGLFLFVTKESVITAEGGSLRLASVYGSPNNVGLLLGRIIPFLLAYWLLVKQHRVVVGGLLLILAVTLTLTQSVGAILIGVPASIIVVVLLIYGRRAWLPILALVVIGVVAFSLLAQISPRFASVLDFTRGTNFFRLRVWESGLEIIQDHPVTGIGLDQFLYIFRGEYIRPDAIWDRDLSHPHNFILDFWTRLGIVGVILFLVLQGAFWNIIKILLTKFRENPLYLALVIGLAGSMIDLLAHGLIDNSIFVLDLAYIFMLLVGSVANLSGQVSNPPINIPVD